MIHSDLQPGDFVKASLINEIKNALLNNITGGKGINVKQLANGSIGIELNLKYQPEIIPFLISSSTQDGTNYRWIYSATKAVKTGVAYTKWTSSTDDGNTYTLYNSNENSNTSTGEYGNGISQANIDTANSSGSGGGTMAMKPIPAATLVWAKPVTTSAGIEWWILSIPNGVDGTCG